MNKILVIGSTNIDMIACVKHLPRPGETVGEARFMQSNGGKGANQAVAAARLGGDVAFVSCLGDDAGAAALRQQFAADGINTEEYYEAYEAWQEERAAKIAELDAAGKVFGVDY